MSTHNSMKLLEPKASVLPSPPATTTGVPRPVSPFAVSCRFDRPRGEFVVHAGARAGGLVVIAVALLAVGALGFVGDAIRDKASRATATTTVAALDVDAPFVSTTPEAGAPTRRVEPTKSRPQAQQSRKAKKQPKQAGGTKTVAAKASKQGAKQGPAATADADAGQAPHARRAGLNYLVLQSFPNQAEAAAARDELGAKGVHVTVERNLPGWAGKGWYSLVGTTGFDMARQRGDFDRHVKELRAMKLSPKPYKWRGAEAVASGQ